MSGDPAVGASQSVLQTKATAVRGHIVRNRRLFLIAGAAVAGGAVVVAIVVNLLSNPSTPKPQPVAITATPDIGDPLVIMRPSNGENGTPLVLAAGKPLFPLPGSGQLSFDQNAPVEAQDVMVEQITSDEGFWIGDNDAQRVFVHVAPEVVAGGSIAPNTLQQSQLINVSGRMEPVPTDAASLGVHDLELTQLTNQSEMIEANSVRLPTS